MHSVLPPRVEPASHTKGIALKLLSVLLFVVMDAISKHLTVDYPTFQIVFFRFAFAFLPLLPFLIRDGGVEALRTKRLFAHLSRGLLGLGAMVLFIFAVARLPLADTASITFAAPLIATALSVPLLAEKVGFRRWIAIAVGFLGVLIIMKPGVTIFNLAALAALGGAGCSAMTVILIRSMTRTERSSTIVFYFTLTGMAGGLCALPFVWVTPSPMGFLLLVSMGLIGGIAQMALTSSLDRAPVSLLAPFEYTKLLFASGFDFVLWATVPGWSTISGSLLVMASGLYIFARERKLGRRRGMAASASPDHGQAVKPPEAS